MAVKLFMVSEKTPLPTTDTRSWPNDLLRNMLDIHRASSDHLTIDMAPTDLPREGLEPVVSMLYHIYRASSNHLHVTIDMAPTYRLRTVWSSWSL
jgi:hypothetical protein